jgi:hypothetical protein
LAGFKRHAGHVYSLLAGSRDAKFGDWAGYTKATSDVAIATHDATDAIKAHSEHVRISAANMNSWAAKARDLALQLAQAKMQQASSSRPRGCAS